DSPRRRRSLRASSASYAHLGEVQYRSHELVGCVQPQTSAIVDWLLNRKYHRSPIFGSYGTAFTRARPRFTRSQDHRTSAGFLSTSLTSSSAGPSGLRRSASHACTSFVLTFR